MTQVRVRVPLGRRQDEMDVHRFQHDVRRTLHICRRCRLAVIASGRAKLRAEDSYVSTDMEVTRRR